MPTYAARMGKRPSQAPRLSVIMAGDEVVERKVSPRDFVCNHVKTIATLLMIFATLLCIVLIVMVHQWKYDKERTENMNACLDVAVVGAGLSGSYLAWRLRETGQRVSLLEVTDRVGGRVRTWHPFPDAQPPVNGELGALLYLPQHHGLLNRTIHALQLTPVEFHPPNQDPLILYFRGRTLTMRELNNRDAAISANKVPYNLHADELRRSPKELRTFYLEQLLANGTNLHTHPLYATDKNNRSLYAQGYRNLLRRVASSEGLQMLTDTSLWRSLSSNGNAALLASLPFDLEGPTTVQEGMDAIPRRLVKEFEDADVTNTQHTVRRNKRLACVSKEDGYYNMIFIHTQTKKDVTSNKRKSSQICARKVVLALPPPALKKIQWKRFVLGDYDDIDATNLQERLTAIDSVPGIVAYFVYSTKWWPEYHEPWIQDVITDLPVKRVRYVGEMRGSVVVDGDGPEYETESTKPRHLFMVANLDGSDYEYYSPLVETTVHNEDHNVHKVSCDNSSHFVQDISRTLAQIYNVKHVPKPDDIYIVDWTRSPSGGARFLWKTGVWWDSVVEKLQKPRPNDDIFVVGDAYCPGQCQLWAEGALQTVETVLKKYPQLTRPSV